jgi:hypothetical protein
MAVFVFVTVFVSAAALFLLVMLLVSLMRAVFRIATATEKTANLLTDWIGRQTGPNATAAPSPMSGSRTGTS